MRTHVTPRDINPITDGLLAADLDQDGRVETYVLGYRQIGATGQGGLWQYANLMLDRNDDGELSVRRKIFPGTVALDISKE